MAGSQSIVGLLGVTLLLARAAFALGGRRGPWLAAGAAVLALVPVGGLVVAGYVRGITGDLSMTTLVVLGYGFVGGVAPRERRALSLLAVFGAALLYPMALGVGAFDPYRLGYAPSGLLAGLALIALLAWIRQLHLVLACILVAVTGHALELMESTNLWDYLIDPWLALASIYDLRWLRRKS